MRAGKLRHRLDVERQRTRQDEYGQELPADAAAEWETVATVWADVRELSGRELTAARQRVALLTHEVEMRYRDWITADMRFKMGGRVLNIAGAPRNPDGRNIALVIDCIEQTTGSK